MCAEVGQVVRECTAERLRLRFVHLPCSMSSPAAGSSFSFAAIVSGRCIRSESTPPTTSHDETAAP